MLISLSRKFIFIANLKTASTSIEAALRPMADIALAQSQFGKHIPFREIERRFSWVFNILDHEEFFIFGIIRDPADFVISIYNSHSHKKFADNPKLFTGGMDFAQFFQEWTKRNPDQLVPQYTRFLTQDGKIGANYIISYSRLEEGLEYVANNLGVPALRELRRLNVSEQRVSRTGLSQEHLTWISRHFERDYAFMERFGDRFLGAEERAAAGRVHEVSAADGLQVGEAPWKEAVIGALYRVLHLREPDAIGLRDGVELLRKGRSFDDLMRGCLRSREFGANYKKFIRTYVRAEHLEAKERPRPSARRSATGSSVSGVMIAYNSEPILSVTLPIIRDCFEELIIVDMGSSDQSNLLYEKFLGERDRVISYDRRNLFQFGFSHPKNYGAKFATSDWIFAIDTDEFIVAEEFMNARDILKETDLLGFSVVRRNYARDPAYNLSDLSTLVKNCKFKEEKHRRLYGNLPRIRFEGLIHEELWDGDTNLYRSAVDIPIILHHIKNYIDEADAIEKYELYAFLLLRASVYPEFRFGTNSWWFDAYVPQNLTKLLKRANQFALRWGLSEFFDAQFAAQEGSRPDRKQ
jgi:glycosyltransferase involved in cell wall biosynthesis